MNNRNFSDNSSQYIYSNSYPATANQVELTPIDSDNDYSKYTQVALYCFVAMCLLVIGFMGMKLFLSHSANASARTATSTVYIQREPKPLPIVGERVLREIHGMVTRQFATGSWRFAGSELSRNNIIQVYVQIPQKLEMEKEDQQKYIQKVLCPAKNSGVWQLIEPRQMQFNLFTSIKRLSVSATCG